MEIFSRRYEPSSRIVLVFIPKSPRFFFVGVPPRHVVPKLWVAPVDPDYKQDLFGVTHCFIWMAVVPPCHWIGRKPHDGLAVG
jgi:hypothetical protein